MKYKRMFAAAFVMVLTVGVLGQGQTNRAEGLLGTALHQEEVEGNCAEAIKTYRKVLEERNAPRAVAGRAQLRIAACQEKLGLRDARGSYELVLNRYADQVELVAQARSRLTNFGAGPQGLSVERIWEGPSIDMEGRPFYDGRSFAYADWSSGSGKLAIRDLRTGEKRLLTSEATSAAFAENPLPSRDGNRIAYRFGEEDSTIRLINADGTNMKVLLHDRHDNYLYDWSPDGRYIAALHNNGDRTKAIVRISTTDGSVEQLKSTGRQDVSLGGFSPDGRFLVYAKNNDPNVGDGGVFALAADGSTQNRLVEGSKQGPTAFRDPIWSADGKRLVFISDRSGVPALWSIRVENGQPVGNPESIRVSVDNMEPRGLTRDGSLYYMKREIQVEAYTAQFDPAGMKVVKPEPITDRAVGNNRGPELSPDGASVAFIRRRVGVPWAIMVRSLAPDAQERIVGTINGSGVYGARTLQWFPDGRSLLVIDGMDQRKRFRKIDVNSSEERLVFDAPWKVWTGAVSADGKSVFYSINEEAVRLVKRDLESGAEAEVSRVKTGGAGLFGLVASPDGASLAFAVNMSDDRRALFIMSTAGGEPRELYRGTSEEGNWPVFMNWTADSKTLLVVGEGFPKGQSLYAMPAAGGSLKPLGVNMEEIDVPAISPGGRRLVFGGRTAKEELWVVRNVLSDLAKAQ